MKNKATSALIAGALIAGSVASAQTTGSTTIDPAPIASAITTNIGTVMAAGAGILAVSVGGRTAVKWIKRLVGFA